MITLNAIDFYLHPKEARLMYTDLLESMGINASIDRVNISPYARGGDFDTDTAAAGAVDLYFDISNAGFGPIPQANIATYREGKSTFLHGELKLTTYVKTQTATNITTQEYLVHGRNDALTHWLYRNRGLETAADANVNANVNGAAHPSSPRGPNMPHMIQFRGAFFNFLRCIQTQVGAGAGKTRCEYLFIGWRIDF